MSDDKDISNPELAEPSHDSISSDEAPVSESNNQDNPQANDGIGAKDLSDSDDEVPEWGKSDPTKFIKYRLGKQEKKHASQMASLKKELEDAYQHGASQNAAAPPPPAEAGYQQQNELVDPYSGERVDPESVRGQVLLEQHRQAFAQQQHELQSRQQQQSQYMDQQTEKFLENLEHAADSYPDFDEVVKNDDLPITETMVEFAKLAPNGVDLLYYLGKNPKEVGRISRMQPIAQAKELMRHLLDIGTRNKISSAPPPVTPLGDGKVKSSGSITSMSFAEIKARERNKHKKRA